MASNKKQHNDTEQLRKGLQREIFNFDRLICEKEKLPWKNLEVLLEQIQAIEKDVTTYLNKQEKLCICHQSLSEALHS